MELTTAVPLRQQCILYVISHVHEFPPHELALLPRYICCHILRRVSALHLFYLEQTSVAEGIDTLQIWREMPNPLPNVVITSPFFNTITNVQDHRAETIRDQYITSIWNAVLNSQPSQLPQLLQEVFKIHTSLLVPVTVNAIKHWTWFVAMTDTYVLPRETLVNLRSELAAYYLLPRETLVNLRSELAAYYLLPRETPVNLRSELAAYLLNLGAFPSILNIQSIDVLEELWRCKGHEALQQLLSRSQVQTLCVKFDTDARKESERFILQAVLRRPQPLLCSLKLWDISGSFLLAISSSAEGLTSLKDLDVRLHQQTKLCHGTGSTLALVISNQVALEEVTLEHVGAAFPSDPEGDLLVSVLSNLLIQPQFRNLTIRGFSNVPLKYVKALTEAFVSCSSTQDQKLFFTCLSIEEEGEEELPERRRAASITVVQKPQASKRSQIMMYQRPHIPALLGPQKCIEFSCTNMPLLFFKWFSALQCVHVNSIELSFCSLDAGTVKKLFTSHPTFEVQSGTRFAYFQ